MIAAAARHAAVLAALHAEAFPSGERWDAAAFASLLGTGAAGLIDERGGCVVTRAGGGEAEILTLAVVPGARRQGIGRSLVAAVLAEAGGGPVFLEVAADNEAALRLYETAGFAPCGRRQHYYGLGRDALVLRSG